MPSISNPLKIAATRSYGANLIFSGSTSPERDAAAKKVIEETGARFVSSYDHPDIILGQGTMGLEMQEQVEETLGKSGKGLNGIIAPCGGGGMLSGIALSAENTGLKIFGAEPIHEGADDAKRGYYSNERIPAVSSLTIADGLRTPLGAHTWSIIRQDRGLVHGMYSVTEEEILETMRLVFERMKMVVEPSACVALAAVLFDEDLREKLEKEGGEEGWELGVVFSGGNVGVEKVAELFGNKN
jgi:threonine dehydratase